MVSITSSTKHAVAKPKVPGKSKAAAKGRKTSIAPKLVPANLANEAACKQLEDPKSTVQSLLRTVQGESSTASSILKAEPHAASTTQSRSGAAGDIAMIVKTFGPKTLREWEIIDEMQRTLFPDGIAALFGETTQPTGLKASASALSLTSLNIQADDDMSMGTATANSMGTDSKRGKTMPPNAREGCLLLIRALCEIVGKPAEPYIVGAFLAVTLDECGSNNSVVRQAADDTSSALVTLAHPWAFPTVLCPLFLQVLETRSTEWRVKVAALERLEQCARGGCASQVQVRIPGLIPPVSGQVWDTKAQVSKAARGALTAICETNTNADVKPAIGAIVNAICKPADTNKAVSELMGTTFVVPVDAPTLAMLCPVLSRALKEKLAIHKRSACLVISNMSKLVVSPQAVAPFQHLLIPELQKVATHVQFEEIRDEALNALSNLTKALGDALQDASTEASKKKSLEEENKRVEIEKARIEAEREETLRKEEEMNEKEKEERIRFKEAMDAQRRLDNLAAEEAKQEKEEKERQREQQKRSTKSASGNCQACGLKKCKKSCMFNNK